MTEAEFEHLLTLLDLQIRRAHDAEHENERLRKAITRQYLAFKAEVARLGSRAAEDETA